MARILITEDEWLIAQDLKFILQKLGHEVLAIAVSGEEAVKIAHDMNPDLIFMDVQLEGDIDGIDAAISIRKDYNIPIIYCTANTDDTTVSKMSSTYPNGLVMKPFSNLDIEKAISPFAVDGKIAGNAKTGSDLIANLVQAM